MPMLLRSTLATWGAGTGGAPIAWLNPAAESVRIAMNNGTQRRHWATSDNCILLRCVDTSLDVNGPEKLRNYVVLRPAAQPRRQAGVFCADRGGRLDGENETIGGRGAPSLARLAAGRRRSA